MKQSIYLRSGLGLILACILLHARSPEQIIFTVTVENPLDRVRSNETIEIDLTHLGEELKRINVGHFVVRDHQSGSDLLSQMIDEDQDGVLELLLVQSCFEAKESKRFNIYVSQKPTDTTANLAQAMFVPTRKDDFAWENNRIAYRMYGPALEADGEISSGVDVWVKRTHELILDKWYQSGYNYHSDKGDGLDYYKVGPSCGCGGSAVWDGSQLYPSNNFTSWKIFANGPIRAIFELGYEPWEIGDITISEVKRITIDAGQNLNRFESRFQFSNSNSDLVNAVGLVKREGLGIIQFNRELGWLGYWEPPHIRHGSTGCGIIIQPNNIQAIEEIEDHNLIITRMLSEYLSYYAGAGWEKSTDFNSSDDWFAYLEDFTLRLQHPLVIIYE